MEAASLLPNTLLLETTAGLGGWPSLEVAFVAVCDTVLMTLRGERRIPLPTSLSGSASARQLRSRLLRYQLARFQRGREDYAVSCPIVFHACSRRRSKPGVALLSATRVRLSRKPNRKGNRT